MSRMRKTQKTREQREAAIIRSYAEAGAVEIDNLEEIAVDADTTVRTILQYRGEDIEFAKSCDLAWEYGVLPDDLAFIEIDPD